MLCATESLAKTVQEAADKGTAATNAAAQQAHADVIAAQERAERLRRQAQDEQNRAAQHAAHDAEVTAGQIDDLEPTTLSRPDAAAMIKMAGRRYRHLNGWPFAQTLLNRFDEAAAPGEQAVGVTGGMVIKNDVGVDGVVVVTTHGLVWSLGADQPVWMPYELIDEIEPVNLVGTVEGVGHRYRIGDHSLTLLPDAKDNIGYLAMLRARDWHAVGRLPAASGRRAKLVEMVRHQTPGRLSKYSPSIERFCDLVDDSNLLLERTAVDKRVLGLWALTDTHAIGSTAEGSMHVYELASISPKKFLRGTAGRFGHRRRVQFLLHSRVPDANGGVHWDSWWMPPEVSTDSWAGAFEKAVRKAQHKGERRRWFSR